MAVIQLILSHSSLTLYSSTILEIKLLFFVYLYQNKWKYSFIKISERFLLKRWVNEEVQLLVVDLLKVHKFMNSVKLEWFDHLRIIKRKKKTWTRIYIKIWRVFLLTIVELWRYGSYSSNGKLVSISFSESLEKCYFGWVSESTYVFTFAQCYILTWITIFSLLCILKLVKRVLLVLLAPEVDWVWKFLTRGYENIL